MKQQEIQLDYTANGIRYQLKMETEIYIPKDDPVRPLSAICERIDFVFIVLKYFLSNIFFL